MESLLTYIVQVNILLTIIYIGYFALLKALTFYKLNRVYFLLGGLFSLVYPFLDIRSLFQKQLEPVGELVAYFPDFASGNVADKGSPTIASLIYGVIMLVGVFLLVKLAVQLLSLLRIHLHSVKASWKRYIYRNVLFPIVPFSFFNRIYVNKEQHQELELYDIFEHEDIHVKGLHTIDILMFEMLLIGCWYNPFVWLMRKAVRQNLEFLTDQQVLNKGVDRQTYQYSLLHVTKQGMAVGVSNQFNFKLLKKRIMMMNKKRSSKLELSKYVFLLPIVIFAAGAFTVSKADGKITEVVNLAKETELKEIQVMLQKPDTFAFVKEENFSYQAVADSSVETAGFVLDGKLVEQRTIEQLDPKEIESAVVNIENAVSQKFGLKSVLSIKTKKFAGKVGTPSQFKAIRFGKDGAVNIDGPFQGFARTENVFEAKKADTTENKWVSNILATPKEKQPLFFVDGKKATETILKNLSPDDIDAISILKDLRSMEKYGEAGKNGVIEITTKGKVAGMAIGNKVSTDSVRNVIIRGVGTKQGNPLIVIDGVEQKGTSTLQHLDVNEIESISILKNGNGEALYGEKGRDGVMLVTTKVAQKKKGQPLIVIDGVKQKDDFTLENMDADKIESMEVVKDANAFSGDKGYSGTIYIKTKDAQNKNSDKLKEVVVVGKSARDKQESDSEKQPQVTTVRLWEPHQFPTHDPASIKKFLDANRGNINLKGDHVLVINGRIAKEADLKNIKASEVTKVGALDLTKENSNLPSNIIGVLFIEDGGSSRNGWSEAWVESSGKRIGIVSSPEKNSSPSVQRK